MANRYSDYSVSAYKPRTTQELMMFPLMKRKLHDDASEKLQTYLGELDKINPLDKHYNEAQQIKSNLTKQIDEQAQQLSKEGFNSNTTSQIFKTNRNIQDMYSPTGKVGQINAAKIGYDKLSEEYLKSATQLGHSPEVVQRNLKSIQDNYNQSPIYDDRGKVVQFAINQLPPKYIDHVARARDFFKDAGITSSQIDNLASRLINKPDGSGYILSQGAKSGDSSNEKQLQSAVNFLNSEIANPNSDVGKSLKYGFKSPEEAIEDIKSVSPIYNKTSRERGYSNQISNLFDAPKDKKEKDDNEIPTGIFDPSTTRTVNTEDIVDIDFNQIGKSKVNMASALANSRTGLAGRGTDYNPNDVSGKVSYKDVMTPIQQKAYEVSFQRLKASHKIPQNAKLTDANVVPQIQTYMTKHLKIPTIGSDIIRPDIVPNGQLFMGELAGKAPADRDQAILQDIRGGYRDVIDPETGKALKKEDWQKGGKAEDWKVQYEGYDSPVNYRESAYRNSKEQSVMPHRVLITDKDGKAIGNTSVSRSPQELKTPVFKKAYEINHVYKNAVNNFGDWVTATGNYSGSRQLKGLQIRQNEDGTFQFRKGKLVSDKMTPGEYANEMNNIMSDVN